jgi:hypothetical protein
MANHIPSELLLDVFKYTDGCNLRLFRYVSRKWNQLFLCQENFLALVECHFVCEIDFWMVTPIYIGPIESYKNVIFKNLRMDVRGDKILFNKQIKVNIL